MRLWLQRYSYAAMLVAASSSSVVRAESQWMTVRDISLAVSADSPLNFANMWPTQPAGASGRVIVSKYGMFAFEKKPNEPVRFLCASLAWAPSESGGFPNKETADRYAEQLQIHGYNAVRFHFIDATLMTGRDKDFDYDPVQLDRFRYFLAALKRRGIYWVMDVMTSPNGAYGNVGPDRWIRHYDLKLDVYLNDDARRHWRRMAETILAKHNPYTKMKPIEDPALALLVLVNENGVEFTSVLHETETHVAYSSKLEPRFNLWLKSKYGGTEALRAAWGALFSGESLEAESVHMPKSREERGPRMRDAQSFFRDLEADTFQWLSREIRDLGYLGLVSQFNNWATVETSFTRMNLPVVTMNSYFDEVWNFDPGFSISQHSSLDDDAGYVRELFGVRWLRKPFVVTEYGQVFWNRFRHEAGLVAPAYAALQGWDLLCLHGAAIDLSYNQQWQRKRAIMPYGVGFDPVARAGETLAALLFRRGDLSTAHTTVAIPFGQDGDMFDAGQGAIPSSLTSLGLLTRLGLAHVEEPEVSPEPEKATTPWFLESLAARWQSRSTARGGSTSARTMRIHPQTASVVGIRAFSRWKAAEGETTPALTIRLRPQKGSIVGVRAYSRWKSDPDLDVWTPRPNHGSSAHSLVRYVAELRQAGVLSEQNRTNPEARVFESETGEIMMDARQRFIRVVTPRTEAASFEHLASPRALGAVTIKAASGPALVALSSLDGEPLATSAHLLLIFATDARNSEMKYRDAAQRTIQNYGHLPVLVKRERVQIQFSPTLSGVWSLSSLHLDGASGDQLTVTMKGTQIEFDLDNAATSHGPTTFFRLDRHP